MNISKALQFFYNFYIEHPDTKIEDADAALRNFAEENLGPRKAQIFLYKLEAAYAGGLFTIDDSATVLEDSIIFTEKFFNHEIDREKTIRTILSSAITALITCIGGIIGYLIGK